MTVDPLPEDPRRPKPSSPCLNFASSYRASSATSRKSRAPCAAGTQEDANRTSCSERNAATCEQQRKSVIEHDDAARYLANNVREQAGSVARCRSCLRERNMRCPRGTSGLTGEVAGSAMRIGTTAPPHPFLRAPHSMRPRRCSSNSPYPRDHRLTADREGSRNDIACAPQRASRHH